MAACSPKDLHLLENGATGVWEEWDGGRSHLHNCYNGIGFWFFEALGGNTCFRPMFLFENLNHI